MVFYFQAYEVKSKTYRGTLYDDDDEENEEKPIPKSNHQTMAQAVQRKVDLHTSPQTELPRAQLSLTNLMPSATGKRSTESFF